jgi:excisionase family DNA binding protein
MADELKVEVMTLKQVAIYLQLDVTTIYRLAQSHRIPATKIGRVWRFRKDLIDKWLEDQIEMLDYVAKTSELPKELS